MPDIDSLNIKIKASSTDASKSIDGLIKSLGKLNASLANYTDNSGYIKGIQNLASGFESISSAVNKIDVGKLGTLSKNLSSITSQLNRIDAAGKKIGSIDSFKSLNVMGTEVKKVADELAKTWGVTDKNALAELEKKFDEYIDAVYTGSKKTNQIFNDLANNIRNNANIVDESKAAYADLLSYVEKTNSAFLKGKGSSVTLGFRSSEFTDDYTSMRATAGAAFTSQVGAGNGDFENYISELNAELGNIIPVGNTAAETFSNFVRILKDARNSTMSFSEAVRSGAVDADAVDDNIIQVSNSVYKLERAMRDAGAEVKESSNSFQAIRDSFNSLSEINIPDATNLTGFVNAVQGLGSAKVQKAADNMPKLAEGLKKLFETLKDAPKVDKSIIDMTNALANLAGQSGRISRSSSDLNDGLGKTSKTMAQTSKNSVSLAKSFGRLYAAWFTLTRGIKKLWSSVENSMSYIETLNYFNAAFEQVASKADLSSWEKLGYESAEAYANSFSERAKELTAKMSGFNINDNGTLTATGQASLGINPDTLMNYQAMFGQMASSMGVASENATLLSQVLSEIGADLASVKNMDFADVWDDMASGLTGMSRTLDKYGVNIRNVNLQQKLTDLGIQANIANLNQQDKALLRTIVLLDSTRYAWGDLADTIQQPANQLRLLQANFQNLSRTIGGLFLPIVQKVLPYINALVIAVQRLAAWIGELLGIDLSGISSSIGGMDTSKLTASLDDATDAMGAASDAADKLKKGIRGFDELNVITTKDDSDAGKGAGIGAGLLDDAFLDAVSEYQKRWDEAFAGLQNRAEELADKISAVLEPIKKLFTDIKIGDWFAVGQDVSGLVSGIFNFFADAIAAVDWYALGQNIGLFLAGINWTEILSSVGRVIWESLKGALEMWIGSFSTAPIETALLTILALPALADFGTKFINLIVTPITKSVGVIKGVAESIGAALAGISTPVLVVIGVLAALAVGLGYVYATNEEVRKGFSDAVKTISESLKPAIEFISDKVIPDLKAGWEGLLNILKPFGEFLQTVFTSIWMDFINPALTYIGETVIPMLLETFKNLWNDVLVPFANFLGSVLEPVINAISSVLKMLWENVVVPLGKAIGDILSKAFEGLVEVLNQTVIPIISITMQSLQLLWDTILKPIASFIMDTLVSAFENLSNTVKIVIESLQQSLGGIPDFITGVLTGNFEKAWQGFSNILKGLGRLIVDGLLGGIVRAMVGIGRWVKDNIVDPFINGFKKFFGIHSPSKVMEEMGGYLMEGLFNGISNLVAKVIDVFKNIKEGISGWWEKTKKDTQEKWDNIKNNVGETWGKISGKATEVWNGITKKITDKWSEAKSDTETKWNNMKSTLDTTWGNLKTNADTNFDSIDKKLTDTWQDISTDTYNKWNPLEKDITEKWNGLNSSATTNFDAINTEVLDTWKSVSDDTTEKWNGMYTKVMETYDGINKETPGKLDALKGSMSSKWGEIGTELSNAWEGFKNTVSNAWESIKSAVGGVVSSVSEAVSGAVQEAASAVEDTTKSMADTTNKALKTVADNTKKVTAAAKKVTTTTTTVTTTKAAARGATAFAAGGFPEDGWFRASKGEYFGQFDDGTSYIANNTQIEMGVAQGVEMAAYRGMIKALREAGGAGNGDINVRLELDGEPIYRDVIKRNQQNRRSGGYGFVTSSEVYG